MKAEPLSKAIYNKAVTLGVKEINLHFSGGSDVGYLNVDFDIDAGDEFETEVRDWAWSVYDYSGAGEGSDYGDDITYNLKDNTVTVSDWVDSPQYSAPSTRPFSLDTD